MRTTGSTQVGYYSVRHYSSYCQSLALHGMRGDLTFHHKSSTAALFKEHSMQTFKLSETCVILLLFMLYING
jgi:hypothetical protein